MTALVYMLSSVLSRRESKTSVSLSISLGLPERAFLHLHVHRPDLDRTLYQCLWYGTVGGTVAKLAAAGADVALDVYGVVSRACCSAFEACWAGRRIAMPIPHRLPLLLLRSRETFKVVILTLLRI